MYYLAWIISAGLAVTVGCFVATRLEKKKITQNKNHYLSYSIFCSLV